MNKAKKNYQKQCTMKTVTFYKKDAEILKYANCINFQKFVKDCLKNYNIIQSQLKYQKILNIIHKIEGDENGNENL